MQTVASPVRARRALRVPAVWVFCAAHLGLIVLGVASLVPSPVAGQGPALDLLQTYRNATVAGERFGFFSPTVPDIPIARLTLSFENGASRREVYGAGSDELDLHRSNLIRSGHGMGTYDLLARLLAVHAFNSHPHLARVTVKLTDATLPSSAQYRAGRRVRFHDFYTGVFVRRAGKDL